MKAVDILLYGVPLLAVAILAALALRHAFGRRPRRALPVHPTPVLTQAEVRFHGVLVAAVARIGGLSVFPQVAMGAILDADRNLDPDFRRNVRNRFDRKIVDFVVVDARTNVVLIVELDDSTHDGDRDRARDEITASAGYATMRIRGRSARDAAHVEAEVRRHLRNHP
jgi:very-short-patch-repair endonuclease